MEVRLRIIAHLIVLTLAFMSGNNAFAFETTTLFGQGDNVKVENVHYTVTNGRVIINYDLVGNPGNTCTVRVFLKRDNYDSFNYTPQNISGDIGEGILPGKNKEIVWNIEDVFSNGLPYKDYYFIVEAKAEDNDGDSGLLSFSWLKIGVAAVVAATTVFFITRTNDSGTSGSSFPPPPGRPKGNK